MTGFVASHYIATPGVWVNTRVYAIMIEKFYTPSVAATSFFTGEEEIFDFVSERVKRCIAANNENGQKIFC